MGFSNNTNLPFNSISNSEFFNLRNISTENLQNSLPNFEIINESLNNSALQSQDVDLNLAFQTDCRYYSVNEFQSLNNTKHLNVFHTNINGLETKFDNLHQFVTSTPFKIDVISITESSQKFNENFKKKVDIDGYDLYKTSTKTQNGGTALYINNNFKSFERMDLKILDDDYETTWCEIVNLKSNNIVIGSIYRHPRYNMVEFCKYIEKTLLKLAKEKKEVYLTGDFNIDLLKIETNHSYQEFYNLLCSFGYLPKIIQPTRVTENESSLIDNIFTNNLKNITISGNILITFSEHFSQFLSVKRGYVDTKSIKIFQHDYSNFESQQFRDDVSIQNFNNNCNNVNDQFWDFYHKLNGCVERHAPVTQLTPAQIKLKNKPWITSQIKKMINIRNKLFKRKKRQPNNSNVKIVYNLFRNRIIRELKKSKKSYYSKYFEENNNNIKKTWSGIREIVNLKNSDIHIITQLNINGVNLNNINDIVNNFNDFFVNVGSNIDLNIPVSDKIKPEQFLKNKNETCFNISHVTEEEVLNIIKSLENKSSGPFSIPLKLLKIVPDLIIKPLCSLINNSFSEGIFPDLLKIAKVIPIHKSNSNQEMNNYRPISLLSIFDKIIEKLMHKRLYKFLEDHNILYNKEFGFRKKNSTIFSLIEITEKIKESIDKGKFGCGIFIDLRKAFDTVNHNILLNKLDHYGIRGIELNWFESYLKERQQYVFLNGESSDLKSITCGVPQGSVLGPLLFLLYINDLPNISKILDFYLFADDTNIYYQDDSLIKLEKIINKDLRALYLWLNVNRLSLNIDKTNFVIFHPFNKPLKYNVTILIHKKAISEQNSIKYLGIIIDSTLSWKDHVIHLSKKLSRVVGILYKLKHFVNKKIMNNIYYALFYSHVIYAIEVWGSTSNIYINNIIILQKRVIRLMSNKDQFPAIPGPLYPTSGLFSELSLLKIKDIFTLQISKFIHKCINFDIISNFNNWFKLNCETHSYQTRSNFNHSNNSSTNNLYIPFGRTTNYGLKSIKINGPKIWNNIPAEIRNIKSLFQFKMTLKKHLLESYL